MRYLLCRFFLFIGSASNAMVRILLRHRYWVLRYPEWRAFPAPCDRGMRLVEEDHFFSNLSREEAQRFLAERGTGGGTVRKPTLKEIWSASWIMQPS